MSAFKMSNENAQIEHKLGLPTNFTIQLIFGFLNIIEEKINHQTHKSRIFYILKNGRSLGPVYKK